MKKKKSLMNALKKLCVELKNSVDEEAASLITAINETITALEESEEDNNVEDVRTAIVAVLEGAAAETEESEEAASAFRALLAKYNTPQPEPKNWLASKESLKAFANCLRKSKSSAEFTNNWGEVLKANGIELKSGVTGLLFPDQISFDIATTWQEESKLFREVAKISDRLTYKHQYTTQAQDDLNVRAKGHIPGNVKTDQAIAVVNKTITAQMLYKQIPVDRITLAAVESDSAFINWLVKELGTQLAYEFDRVVLVGDGRLANSVDKISSIESIGEKTVTDAFTIVNEAAAETPTIADFQGVADNMIHEAPTVLYISRQTQRKIGTRVLAAGGTPINVTLAELAQEIGVQEVRTTDIPLGDNLGIFIQPQKYARIGGEPFGEQWTAYLTNQEYFRSEVVTGAGIVGLWSTGVLKAYSE